MWLLDERIKNKSFVSLFQHQQAKKSGIKQMPKNRFTSLDTKLSVQDIRDKIIGFRLANIYDLNKKTYLLKFAKTDNKVFVVIESGIRIHTTTYTRERNDIPSIFAMKVILI